MDLADGGGMGFLSFSGGGDPLWMLDARRAEWYSTLTRRLHALGIETEMHTSMPPMTERLYRLASETELTRIVYHLRNVNMIRRLSKRRNELVRVVFVVTPDFTEDLIDRIVEEVKANPQVDELSFRQMVKPDYTIDRTCETYLRAGHRKDWCTSNKATTTSTSSMTVSAEDTRISRKDMGLDAERIEKAAIAIFVAQTNWLPRTPTIDR